MKQTQIEKKNTLVSVNIDRSPYHDKLRETAFKQNRAIKEILEELIEKYL